MANYGFGSGSGSGSGSSSQSYIPPTPEVDYGVTLPASISPQPVIDSASVTLQNIQSAVNTAIQNCIATGTSVKGQLDACVSQVVEQAISDNSVFLNSLGATASQAISNLYAAAQEYAMPLLSGKKQAIATGPQGVVLPQTQSATTTQQTVGDELAPPQIPIGTPYIWGGFTGSPNQDIPSLFDTGNPPGTYYWDGKTWSLTNPIAAKPISVQQPNFTVPNANATTPPSQTAGGFGVVPPTNPNLTPSGNCVYDLQGNLVFPLMIDPSGSGGEVYPNGSPYIPLPGFTKDVCNPKPNNQPLPPVVPIPPTFPQPPPAGPPPPPCPPIPVVKVETCRTYDLITDIIRGQLATEKDILTAYMGGPVGALLNSATLADASIALYKLTPHLDPADIVPSAQNKLVSLTEE